MRKTKTYQNTKFGTDVVREAFRVFTKQLPEGIAVASDILNIKPDDAEGWRYDTDEEFFAAYRKPCVYAFFYKAFPARVGSHFQFNFANNNSAVEITRPRAPEIEEVFDVFERNLAISQLPEPISAPANLEVFIGHGRSPLWRDLKDHLTDKHGYSVTAYEVGARAGHTIRDILDEMLTESSFALLVMTGEDETSSGEVRARQNVVHEVGLFQGKLGFSRAIVIAEKDVELFSNIDGVQQLRFNPGNIAEVYGDVLATLRREFGHSR